MESRSGNLTVRSETEIRTMVKGENEKKGFILYTK